MNLLVLGANSHLGKAFTGLLKRCGIEHSTLTSKQIDLLKQMEVVKTVNQLSPSQVVNVADFSNLEEAETDPEAARQCDIYNSRGISILAEACNHLNLPLIHLSSSYVFDGTKKSAYTEDDQTNPVSRYGMSKWYAERAIRETLEQHVILRTDFLFSVQQTAYFRKLIDTCKQQHGQMLVVNHRFSPTFSEDVARVLLAMVWQLDCAANVWGTYHYCALQALSQAQFVEHFLRESAAYDPVLTREIESLDIEVQPPVKPNIANTVLNCQKIMETFGIKQRSRAAGITAVLEEIYRPGKSSKRSSKRKVAKKAVGPATSPTKSGPRKRAARKKSATKAG